MKDEENFFEHQSEQSMIKAKIVSYYFTAWSRIMCKNWSSSIPVGYVDLFSGPGVYKDGNESVSIMLIKTVLKDMELGKRFWFYFNDQDENNMVNCWFHSHPMLIFSGRSDIKITCCVHI